MDRAYKALNENDYFLAKKIFYKKIHSHTTASAFGLAKIYTQNNNPFYNLDSAYNYIQLANRKIKTLDLSKQKKIEKWNVNSSTILQLENIIDSLSYTKAFSKNSILELELFLQKIPTTKFNLLAKQQINLLAFEEASKQNSVKSYEDFIQRYPQAVQIQNAKKSLDFCRFRDMASKKKTELFAQFILDFPQSEYIENCQDSIFRFSAPNKTEVQLINFIRNYPNNKNVEYAWQLLYEMGNDNSANFFSKFITKYPDYPYLENVAKELSLAQTDYLKITDNGKWGFVDIEGKIRIEPKFEWLENFTEGLCPATLNGKVGYINKFGKTIIDFLFEEGEEFKEGRAVVKVNNKFSVIDRNGKIISENWDEISDFSEGFAAVKKYDNIGYINKNGELAIECKFASASDFVNGKAIVEFNKKFGVILNNGVFIIPNEFEWIDDFRGDLCRVQKDELFGLVAINNPNLILPQYDFLEFLNNETLLAIKEDKCGIINVNGSIVSPFNFEFSGSINDFGHGRVIVQNTKNKKGIINYNGKTVLPFEYKNLKLSADRFIPFEKKLKWGLTDSTQKIILKPNFDDLGNFDLGVAKAKMKKKWGIVDISGKWIIKPECQNIEQFSTYFVGKKNNLLGLISNEGKWLYPPVLEEVRELKEDLLLFQKNNSTAVYNIKSKTFIYIEKGFEVQN
jgi:hypothetical protein